MAKNINLDVVVRDGTGTGNARASRRAGNVPAVLYGGGEASVAIEMRLNEVNKAINSGKFIASMVTLTHDGKPQNAITKDIQFHPVTDIPVHVDFFRVNASDIIQVEVSVNFLNEDICPGLKEGGTLNVVRYSIEVSCPAGSIPDAIDVDLAEVEMEGTVHISDVTFPKGVT
ncbi:MAG: 50S ribosomal protein L25/general stress protein Ctc, partial [Robiginitomaculum sp.]